MNTIKNLDRLLAKLDAAGTQAAPIMEKGVKKGTKLIQGSAKDLCPEDTGALRNSIRTRTKLKENIVTGDVYTNEAYAAYVEFGTGQRGEAAPKELPDGLELHYKQDWKGMAPQPYLYPALVTNKDKVMDVISSTVKREIIKAVKQDD